MTEIHTVKKVGHEKLHEWESLIISWTSTRNESVWDCR